MNAVGSERLTYVPRSHNKLTSYSVKSDSQAVAAPFYPVSEILLPTAVLLV